MERSPPNSYTERRSIYGMSQDSTRHAGRLEKRASALFLAAGGLLVVYGILNGMEAFFDIAYPTVQNIFGPAGFISGFVGLLTLYWVLDDRNQILTRFGAVSVTLGAVGFSAIVAVNIGVLAGVIPGEPPTWTAIFVILAAIGMVPGFLAFAVAALQTDVYPRRVGLLLLIPPVIFATMVVGASVGYTPAWSAFVISGGQAVAHLAIGYMFRNSLPSINHEVSSTEVPAG